ncbi:MAG: delta-60 repeat domain-containing protein [Xanthomonadales bacterium]|nr:delta-60 repeat domain-containing protein [Xanthomonadales bacterium]
MATYDNSNQTARSLLVQADGKIVVAGIENNGNDTDFALIRYNTDGSRDPGFGEGGAVSTDILGARAIYSGDQDFATLRYDNDGNLDTGFNTNGIKVDWIGRNTKDVAVSLLAQADGKLIAAGRSSYNTSGDLNSPTDIALVRYNINASLDTDFAIDGRATKTIVTPYSAGKDLIGQVDGKIVCLVESYDGSAVGGALMHLSPEPGLNYLRTGKR